MPLFEFTERHNLSKNEAKIRLTGIVDSLINEFRGLISMPQISWKGDTARFSYKLMGKTIEGILKINQKKVVVRIQYPLFMRPFKSVVMEVTRKRAKALLGKENKYGEVS